MRGSIQAPHGSRTSGGGKAQSVTMTAQDQDQAQASGPIEGGVAYQYAAVQQITENRENIEYQLTMREQPKHSRMCGVGEKADRRPIDPAPIVQLRVITHDRPLKTEVLVANSGTAPSEPGSKNTLRTSTKGFAGQVGIRRGVPVTTASGEGWEDKAWYLENPYYFMYAMLCDAETDEELHLLQDGKTRYTSGSCVSCLYHLKDIDGSHQGFFVFPDLSIRVEGRFRLKLCLFETIGHSVHHCKSIYSAPFNVFTAKRFPGMEESTRLSKSFADQGLKVRVRKNPRSRRRGSKRKEGHDRNPLVGTGPSSAPGYVPGPVSRRSPPQPSPPTHGAAIIEREFDRGSEFYQGRREAPRASPYARSLSPLRSSNAARYETTEARAAVHGSSRLSPPRSDHYGYWQPGPPGRGAVREIVQERHPPHYEGRGPAPAVPPLDRGRFERPSPMEVKRVISPPAAPQLSSHGYDPYGRGGQPLAPSRAGGEVHSGPPSGRILPDPYSGEAPASFRKGIPHSPAPYEHSGWDPRPDPRDVDRDRARSYLPSLRDVRVMASLDLPNADRRPSSASLLSEGPTLSGPRSAPARPMSSQAREYPSSSRAGLDEWADQRRPGSIGSSRYEFSVSGASYPPPNPVSTGRHSPHLIHRRRPEFEQEQHAGYPSPNETANLSFHVREKGVGGGGKKFKRLKKKPGFPTALISLELSEGRPVLALLHCSLPCKELFDGMVSLRGSA
ncbi:hypothetical protein IE53DRAFT_129792 [Violaceomyces palustris]|uniref:Uncharacterized protein n=1 Tax=Violaceomyces palustris TaxID=1673888 RepID=A0ACD0P6N5_9BASI|nr:hypothetical protein IE53DRAFT_129792 [Violaceomyces palustris]